MLSDRVGKNGFVCLIFVVTTGPPRAFVRERTTPIIFSVGISIFRTGRLLEMSIGRFGRTDTGLHCDLSARAM